MEMGHCKDCRYFDRKIERISWMDAGNLIAYKDVDTLSGSCNSGKIHETFTMNNDSDKIVIENGDWAMSPIEIIIGEDFGCVHFEPIIKTINVKIDVDGINNEINNIVDEIEERINSIDFSKYLKVNNEMDGN